MRFPDHDNAAPEISRSWDDANRVLTLCNIHSTIEYAYDGSGLTDFTAEDSAGVTNSGKDFQRKQEGAIRQIDHRLANMTKQNFEKQFGKGTATPENMARKAAELTKMRDALKDNGARGYYANAVTNAFMKSVGNPGATGLTYPSDRQSIYLNVDTGFSQNAVKHESAHNAGLSDVRVHGHSAYLNGSPDQQRAFYSLPLSNPAGALLNADTLANYAR